MATIEIEREVAHELALFKLRNIRKEVKQILEKWNTTSIEEFTEKARLGILEESENDAIDIKQLVAEEKKISDLIEQIMG
ncbi:MAG: hypothetical protein ACXAD7_23685 [Candidatus Kariarchaeaceae archaeon]|jgi:hypothetical protein